MMIVAEQTAPDYGARPTCTALGLSRATFYRRRRAGGPPRLSARRPPRKLTDPEERRVLDTLNSDRFGDQAVPLVVGYYQGQGPGAADLLPPVRDDRRVQPLRGRVGLERTRDGGTGGGLDPSPLRAPGSGSGPARGPCGSPRCASGALRERTTQSAARAARSMDQQAGGPGGRRLEKCLAFIDNERPWKSPVEHGDESIAAVGGNRRLLRVLYRTNSRENRTWRTLSFAIPRRSFSAAA